MNIGVRIMKWGVSLGAFIVTVMLFIYEVSAGVIPQRTYLVGDVYTEEFALDLSLNVNSSSGSQSVSKDIVVNLAYADDIKFRYTVNTDDRDGCEDYCYIEPKVTVTGENGSTTYRLQDVPTVDIAKGERGDTTFHIELNGYCKNCPKCNKYHYYSMTISGMDLIYYAPVIYSEPADVCAGAGSEAVMAFTCEKALGYQWQKKKGDTFVNIYDSKVEDGEVYSGCNSPTLTLKELKMSQNGNIYKCCLVGKRGLNRETRETMLTVTDSTGPVINVTRSEENYTSSNVTLYVDAYDGESMVDPNGYSYDGGYTFSNKMKYEVKENCTVCVAVKDMYGNVTKQEVIVNNIDKTVPVMDVIVSPTKETAESVHVCITASDEGLGMGDAPYYYQGEWHAEPEFDITVNGSYTVKVRDMAGNEVSKKITVSNVGKAKNTDSSPSDTESSVKEKEELKNETVGGDTGEETEKKTKEETAKNTEIDKNSNSEVAKETVNTNGAASDSASSGSSSGSTPSGSNSSDSTSSGYKTSEASTSKSSSGNVSSSSGKVTSSTSQSGSSNSNTPVNEISAGGALSVSSSADYEKDKAKTKTALNKKTSGAVKKSEEKKAQNLEKEIEFKENEEKYKDNELEAEVEVRQKSEETETETETEDEEVARAYDDTGYDPLTVVLLFVLGIILLMILLYVLFFGVLVESLSSETKQWTICSVSLVFYHGKTWNLILSHMAGKGQMFRIRYGVLFVAIFEGYGIKIILGHDDNDYLSEEISQGMVVNTRRIRRRV